MSEIELVQTHLRNQFERGRPILFTGAGFSSSSKNLSGDNLPTGNSLAKILWSISFPSEPFDETSTLQDIYETALSKDPKTLKDTLTRQLTVDPTSVDEKIVRYFTFPWHRVYTLNVDNLPDAINRGFKLPRPLSAVALSNAFMGGSDNRGAYQALVVYYLNGLMTEGLDKVTFASTQYAKRLAFPEHLYMELVADIISRPVVFVGTRLDEPSLWQQVEIRKAKGSRDMREMRPRSYLVTPMLDRARAARLSEFNITWLQMTADEFSEKVLKDLGEAKDAGLKLFRNTREEFNRVPRLSEVAELATEPNRQSEFLLGQEPIWADIQSNRAIERGCDGKFVELYTKLLSAKDPRILLICGTAGSGKSTCLMRLVLKAAAQGSHVGWVDKDNELSPRDIIQAMKQDKGPSILAIDDADLFGTSLSPMLYDIVTDDRKPLVIIALRSGVVDRVIDAVVLRGIEVEEVNVPHLTDDDIESLLQVLDRENRLGALKGKSREEQCAKFREYAGRQLLVAMFSATSGDKFQEKVPKEFFDLPQNLQRVYAVICLSTTFRYPLTRQEILLALNDSTNEALNAIDTLLRRHIVVETPPGSVQIQARHRVIADMVKDELLKRGQIADAIFGLGFMAATHRHSDPSKRRKSRKLLTAITNHDFLYRSLSLDQSQLFYQNIEDLLADDSHYWLQRGSLEVEFGDTRRAENWLNQARGLAPGDIYIDNEWAYLLFKKALENPKSSSATEYVKEATATIEAIIQNPKAGPYPYHVLGSQGLAWSKVGIPSDEEKRQYINSLRMVVDNGVNRYPKNNELRKLKEDLMRAYLMLAISPSNL